MTFVDGLKPRLKSVHTILMKTLHVTPLGDLPLLNNFRYTETELIDGTYQKFIFIH